MSIKMLNSKDELSGRSANPGATVVAESRRYVSKNTLTRFWYIRYFYICYNDLRYHLGLSIGKAT